MAKVLKCRRCGSTAIRRSMPRTGFERMVRAWTPFHYYLCRECNCRGVRLGPIPTAGDGAIGLTSRPMEARDRDAARRRMWRILGMIVIASALGTACGMYLHGCRKRAETAAANPPPAPQE